MNPASEFRNNGLYGFVHHAVNTVPYSPKMNGHGRPLSQHLINRCARDFRRCRRPLIRRSWSE